MADIPPLSTGDLNLAADYLKAEFDDRKFRRRDKEEKWKEIDRQLAMKPKAREVLSGQNMDWYPALEESLQYNSLEVILTDLHGMIFPPGSDWFTPLANLSEDYLERFQRRRQTSPLVGAIPDEDQTDAFLDQETADALVKAALDYFHRMYDFRSKINLAWAEQVKYGCGVTRVKPVDMPKFHHEHRGTTAESLIGPSLAPTSIWNTYRDPSPHFILHEGTMILPTIINHGFQLLESMKRAAKTGGKERGWFPGIVSRLEPMKGMDRRGMVERITAEGDIIVPKSRGSIFLPNVEITVAIGAGGARVVRIRKNPTPYRSYVFMDYMCDDVRDAYGGSPLLKGQPIQESLSFILNDAMAVANLNARPPISYDRSDTGFYMTDGPDIYPGAKWKSDNPELIKVQEIGDLNGLIVLYQGLLQKYNELTAVNDPRRGGGVKSHTGTNANLADLERTVARTSNVADDHSTGSLPTILNMEYDIIKRHLTKKTAIPVDDVGIEGWVNITKDDLADQVMFRVRGAAGLSQKQKENQDFITATQMAVQMVGFAAQLGQPIDIDFVSIIAEAYQRVGIQNASRFVRRAQATPPGPPQPPEQDGTGGLPVGAEPALEAIQAGGGELQF